MRQHIITFMTAPGHNEAAAISEMMSTIVNYDGHIDVVTPSKTYTEDGWRNAFVVVYSTADNEQIGYRTTKLESCKILY